MIGVHMGVQRIAHRQAQFTNERRIALVLLEHGIDDDRLCRLRTAEQVGVGR